MENRGKEWGRKREKVKGVVNDVRTKVGREKRRMSNFFGK